MTYGQIRLLLTKALPEAGATLLVDYQWLEP